MEKSANIQIKCLRNKQNFENCAEICDQIFYKYDIESFIVIWMAYKHSMVFFIIHQFACVLCIVYTEV